MLRAELAITPYRRVTGSAAAVAAHRAAMTAASTSVRTRISHLLEAQVGCRHTKPCRRRMPLEKTKRRPRKRFDSKVSFEPHLGTCPAAELARNCAPTWHVEYGGLLERAPWEASTSERRAFSFLPAASSAA